MSKNILKAMSESQIIGDVSDDMLRGVLILSAGMVGVKDLDEPMTVMICRSLKKYYQTFAIDELLLAFELNANGQLDDRIEAYGVFDVALVSKILDAYRFKRIEARKELERNKPKLEEAKPATDEELYNGLMKFAEFPEYYNFSAVFRHLEKTGKLVLTLEEKKRDYLEIYKELSDRITFADRANIQESEFQETVKQECRKRAVKLWYDFNKKA